MPIYSTCAVVIWHAPNSRRTASRYQRNGLLHFGAQYSLKNNAVVMTFLRHYFIVCTALFLLSNLSAFPIDFINILLKNFYPFYLRIFARNP